MGAEIGVLVVEVPSGGMASLSLALAELATGRAGTRRFFCNGGILGCCGLIAQKRRIRFFPKGAQSQPMGRLKMLPPRVATVPNRLATVISAPGSWRAGKTTDERGYTYRWRKFREAWLRRHPLCGDRADGSSAADSACVRAERVTLASDVDHIVPHRGDKDLFWRGPFQSLCADCHRAKTQRELQEEANATT